MGEVAVGRDAGTSKDKVSDRGDASQMLDDRLVGGEVRGVAQVFVRWLWLCIPFLCASHISSGSMRSAHLEFLVRIFSNHINVGSKWGVAVWLVLCGCMKPCSGAPCCRGDVQSLQALVKCGFQVAEIVKLKVTMFFFVQELRDLIYKVL
ncbi:hypothetical protein U1Q18_016669 [Sarracenia purpurea var. burkii]